MKRMMIIALILFSTISLASCGMHKYRHGGGGHGKYMVHKISSELDLTDTQEADLKGIFSEWETKKMAKKGEHAAHMDALIAEVKKDKVDKKVIDRIHKTRATHMAERSEFFSTKLVDFHQTLTAEQKVKLAELLGEWKEKHHRYSGM